eukprot:6031546-Pyramimonas_sp.AAC.1
MLPAAFPDCLVPCACWRSGAGPTRRGELQSSETWPPATERRMRPDFCATCCPTRGGEVDQQLFEY